MLRCCFLLTVILKMTLMRVDWIYHALQLAELGSARSIRQWSLKNKANMPCPKLAKDRLHKMEETKSSGLMDLNHGMPRPLSQWLHSEPIMEYVLDVK
ncbi:hypothetical protein F4860DRAFT_198583 [Xylaria cubensis]|nr:hypothetical protein F4860DRAFT_198583 [Xylaria cubensis]